MDIMYVECYFEQHWTRLDESWNFVSRVCLKFVLVSHSMLMRVTHSIKWTYILNFYFNMVFWGGLSFYLHLSGHSLWLYFSVAFQWSFCVIVCVSKNVSLRLLPFGAILKEKHMLFLMLSIQFMRLWILNALYILQFTIMKCKYS